MSHPVMRKAARMAAVVAALAGASLGNASAGTLAHHGEYAAASSQASVAWPAEGSPVLAAEDRDMATVRPSPRTCIHGHLAHDHC